MKKILTLVFALILAVYSFGQTTTVSTSSLNDMGSGNPPVPNMSTGQIQVNPNPVPNTMTQWVLPNVGSTSGNSRIPRNAGVYFEREELLVLPSEMAAAGYPGGYTIDALGFLIATAGVGTQTGTLNIYLMNTNDVTYTLGSTWTTAGFTQVCNNPTFTIPIAVGAYSIPFVGGSTFTYTGGGVYVAWEFSNPTMVAGTTALVAYCNTNQASLCYGYQSAVSQGTALALTAFRPAMTFTNNTLTDIIAVTNIYSTERMPTPYNNPGTIGVRVSNVSASASSFNLTLTIKDVATNTTRYTSTQPVTALAAGAASVVSFAGISPTLEENVNITASTSVIAGETYTANNTLTISGEVNCNRYSYNYNTASGQVGYGFTYPGAGIFAAKYHMNGTGSIKGANIVIANYATNPGNTIYAVLLDNAGTILASSPNYTILAGDMTTNKYFAFPAPVSLTNTDYYIGMAMTAGTAQYYPLGIFSEVNPRGNTFFTTAITGGAPGADAAAYKYGIEAIIQRAPTVVTTAATAVTSTTATLNATVSANTQTTTTAFQYSTDLSFSSSVAVAGNVTTQLVPVSAGITGLQPNTTYNFRAVSTNADGVTTGNTMQFTTVAIPPTVVTNAATLVGPTFATLNGTATAFNANTTVSFEYGTSIAYGQVAAATPGTVTGNLATNFNSTLGSLVINTTYHFRAKGVNVAGTVYGTDQTFFTTCVVPPTPGSITGPAAVCQSTGGYTYSVPQVPYGFIYNWTFPAGFTITTFPNSNVVTVSVSGAAVPGTISVYASSNCGANSPSTTMAVAVNPLPVPTVTGASPVCQSTNNNYTSQSGMTGYTWTAGDGTVTPTGNPGIVTINWPTAGAKTVGVIYTNPATGCTAAAQGTLPVTVNAAPVPTITGSNNLCVNSGYYDYLTQSGKTAYVWTVSSGGLITGGQGTFDVEIQWNTPGAQWVAVNYNNGSGCSAPAATVFNVNVNGIPGTPGAISGPTPVCVGSQGITYSVPPVTNAVSYVWNVPAGVTIASGSGTNSITVNFAANAVTGDFTVYGNSICGNGPVSAAYTVTVTQIPAAAGSVSGDNAVCAGSMSVPYSVAPIASATGYNWTLPTGATISSGNNTPNIMVDYAVGALSGNITVSGVNSCGTGTVSPSFAVTVYPMPDAPQITNHGDTLYSSIANNNQWFYEGAPVTTGTGQTFVAHYTGTYWDEIVTNGCESDTSNHIYITVTGVNDPSESNFVVYPVPNDGQFKLIMNAPAAATYDISISNNIGVNVYSRQNVLVNGQKELKIDLRPVAAGVYTMVIRNGENKVVRKIIVNR